MNHGINHFNQIAQAYDSDPVKVLRAQTFAEKIKSEIKISPDFTELDYGCGTGLTSFFLQPFMKKNYSLLTSPGYLCVGDLDKEDGCFHGQDFIGHNGFDWEDLASIAKAVGFKNIRFRNFFHNSGFSF